ncbi:MAG: aminopeptidase P family protein [Lachnospiraceae bacterium]|nr:aminopeptidase P family protein [Lachnospiraceae bacterium]
MKEVGIDVTVIPTSDCHNSEYVAPHFKAREYFSGFTGSAGTLIVSLTDAWLYTDGRYFIQAKEELQGTGITLMRSGQKGVPKLREHLKSICPAGSKLGFDPSLFTVSEGMGFLADHPGDCKDIFISESAWPERPRIVFNPVTMLDERYSGESLSSKIKRIRDVMNKKGAFANIVSSLDNIAWILNLRGSDIEYCPLFYSYLVIREDEIFLYANIGDEDIRAYLGKNGVTVRKYEDFYKELEQSTIIRTGDTVLFDSKDCNYRIYTILDDKKCELIDSPTPSNIMKAVKNTIERENIKKAHILDAVSIVRFEKWLDTRLGFWIPEDEGGDQIDETPLNEISVADKLLKIRSTADSFIGPSFETICAYGKNAAIVHYSASNKSNTEIKKGGVLLIDSGGHYLEGTTDITRTYLLYSEDELKDIPPKLKRDYTLVAIGMLKLLNSTFKYGARGSALDTFARQPLWNYGLDFDHGTGHGVGYLLNVHEGPNRISYRAADPSSDAVFEEGMVTSDEPGIYIEGKYGIRIENLILCVKDKENEFGQFLRFDPLTMVPIDLKGIDTAYMSDEDRDNLNNYHRRVLETLSPYLNENEIKYLKHRTEKI